jgi:hypothetical protein
MPSVTPTDRQLMPKSSASPVTGRRGIGRFGGARHHRVDVASYHMLSAPEAPAPTRDAEQRR